MRSERVEQLKELKEFVEKVGNFTNKNEEASNSVKEEYEDVDIEIRKEELRGYKLRNNAIEGENQGDAQDREQRKEFAEKIFEFVRSYMIAVFVMLFLKAITPRFYLSDNVIITLLGTTTANVIGILIIVVTYLFSRKRK